MHAVKCLQVFLIRAASWVLPVAGWVVSLRSALLAKDGGNASYRDVKSSNASGLTFMRIY